MQLQFYQVNVFSSIPFDGKPVYVVPLNEWLPDDLLHKIANENPFRETAFFINGRREVQLRTFEGTHEVCGGTSAAIAITHVKKTVLNKLSGRITFTSGGKEIRIAGNGDGYSIMIPAASPLTCISDFDASRYVSINPESVYMAGEHIVFVYGNETDLTASQVLRSHSQTPRQIILTSKGDNWDFISKMVSAENAAANEINPQLYSYLVPYWAERLKRKELFAIDKTGKTSRLFCLARKNKVIISGKARLYASGS